MRTETDWNGMESLMVSSVIGLVVLLALPTIRQLAESLRMTGAPRK